MTKNKRPDGWSVSPMTPEQRYARIVDSIADLELMIVECPDACTEDCAVCVALAAAVRRLREALRTKC